MAFFTISSSQSAVITCTNPGISCNIASITPVTSQNEVITVPGQPSTYVDNSSTSIQFSTPMVLNFVPTNIFKIFPNTQSVGLFNVSLTNLVSNAFANCGNLISITISQNNFPTLPASFAPTCINVTQLMISYNRIKTFDNEALKGLTFLTMFYASYNNVTCIPPGLFKNTPIIQYIDLGYNQISEIDRTAFTGLANLNSVMLSGNRIVNLPSFDLTLTGSTMGFSMMIDNNPINSINPTFLGAFFTSRMGNMISAYLYFMNSQNISSCIPPQSQFSSIGTYNWAVANISLPTCYANWKSEYAMTPVTCAPIVTPESTTRIYGSGSGRWPFGSDKNFFAIISDTMKNFTANVSFY